jgi:drug/metabolite transporter (DMT)-like permease
MRCHRSPHLDPGGVVWHRTGAPRRVFSCPQLIVTSYLTPQPRSPADTPKGIAAMLAAMGLFTTVDTLIKLTSTSLPLGEMILLRNGIASVCILAYGFFAGGMTLPAGAPRAVLGWRMFAEMFSTLTFLSALVVMPIADVTGIMQFMPLALTAAAAVFLKEPVGWRRWLAALVGLAGVLLIVPPGAGAFSPGVALAFAAIGFVVLRDIMTRQIGMNVPTKRGSCQRLLSWPRWPQRRLRCLGPMSLSLLP